MPDIKPQVDQLERLSQARPKEWIVTKIGTVATLITKGATPTTYGYYYTKEGVLFLRVEDTTEDGQIKSSRLLFINQTTNQALQRSQLEAGDILVSIAGTIGRTAVVKEMDLPANINQALALIRVDQSKIDPRFLQSFILSELGQKLLLSQVIQLAQANISLSQIASTQIFIPPISEQRHIADILDILDTQIQQTEQLIVKLKQIRVGLLHDLLTRGIDENGDMRDPVAHPEEFKKTLYGKLGLPAQWNIYPLERIAKISSGVTLGRNLTGSDTVELPYLRVANVQDGYLDLKEMKTIRVRKDEVNRFLLQPGDVLMTEGGDFDKLGRGTVWTGEIPQCLHQNHIFKVRTNRQYLYPDLLGLVSRSFYGKHFFLLSSKQSTNLASINSTQLKAFPIPCPTKKEQERILGILNTHDARISTEESDLAKLKQLKKGLMHDLLTGCVRVTSLIAESELASI